MAHFVRNDTNFHGARSKTRKVENHSSKKQDIVSKSSGNDDNWDSLPQSSSSASNCNEGWGDVPQDSTATDNAWGQDRQVYGKAERNRRFRSNNNSSTFRVPNQSRPNWDDADEEFPALGGNKRAPTCNVWEKRKEKFEEIKAIEPSNQTEEERMIQKAIELSKLEINHEEEKRRQLEEEYRLQMQLLEANPDQFDEFRLNEESYKAATNDKYDTESYGGSNGYEEFPNVEIGKDSTHSAGGWDLNENTIKKKDLKKEKSKYESPKEEDSIPQSKLDSWSQPGNTASRKSSNSGARPKISKVIDMFGGWGTAKPAATASYQDNSEGVPDNRSSKWDTVDVDFPSKSSKQKNTAVKTTNKLSSPDPPEVKIDNTFSNWDTAESGTSKLPNWDTSEIDSANNISSCDVNETVTAAKLSAWDTVETIGGRSRNASLTPEEENCKVPSIVTQRQEDIIEVASKDENWGVGSLNLEDSSRASDKVELNSEKYVNGYDSSEQINSKSKANLKTQLRSKSQKGEKNVTSSFDKVIISDSDSSQNFKINKPEYQIPSFEQSHDISSKMSVRQAETKAKIDSLEGKCFDSHSSVESDYAFLLKNIDSNYNSSNTQSEIPNLESKLQTENLQSRNSSSFLEKEHQLGISQLANQTASSFRLPEDTTCEDHSISVPHPMYANYKEASSSASFGGYPGQAEYDLIPTRNGGSHIDPPKAALPTPEMINPVFMPQPMMNPLMNPTLMMGMNPLLMQQMMMLNPFFLQQFRQMDMYYKSMGMSLGSGLGMYPQPMPLPNFANNPNPQVFDNLMGNSRPDTEGGIIPPPVPTTSGSSPPGIDATHLLAEDSSEVDQPDDAFWFNDYLSSDPSSLIPPPTPVSDPINPSGVTEAKMSPIASSLSLGAASTFNEGNAPVNRSVTPVPVHQPHESAVRSPEVPYATGWGDINEDSKSSEAAGWCDNADGWGSESASTSRSVRNPSHQINEKKTTYRQPASRPYFGYTKT